MMNSGKHRYFGFHEPDEKKKELVEKLKNGIPDNMFVF